MKAFISYARKDAEMVELLRRDPRRAVRGSTLDRPLGLGRPAVVGRDPPAGAQLRRVRLRAEQELTRFRGLPERVALRDARRRAPPASGMKVTPLDLALAPDEIRQTQVIDYLERTTGHGDRARPAIMRLGPTPPLPSPLPTAPPMPESYGEPYRRQLAAKSIDLTGQAQLFAALEDPRQRRRGPGRGTPAARDAAGPPGRDRGRRPGDRRVLEAGTGVTGTTCAEDAGEEEGRQLERKAAEGRQAGEAGPIQLPVAQLIELLTPFQGVELHVSPEIPEKPTPGTPRPAPRSRNRPATSPRSSGSGSTARRTRSSTERCRGRPGRGQSSKSETVRAQKVG